MKDKNILVASLAVKGTEIASELCGFGMHAVARPEILGKIPENTEVLIVDNTTGEMTETVKNVTAKSDVATRIFVLTGDEKSGIFEENGVLYIPDAKSVVEIVRFCTGRNDVENVIKKMLLKLGFFAYLRGYRYIVDAVEIILENPEATYNLNAEVYPTIAKMHDRSKISVERSIRNAIETAYDHDISGRFNNFFGYKVQRPTNAEFISLCMEKILMRNY